MSNSKQRTALLWKYGGVYSDLDTLTLKSFEPILRSQINGLGMIRLDWYGLNNAVLLFKPRHWFIQILMDSFVQDYNPYLWGANGPILFFNLLKRYCKDDDAFFVSSILPKLMKFNGPFNETEARILIASANETDKCRDLVIFPEYYFNPFRVFDYSILKLFVPNGANDLVAWARINDSFAIHYHGSWSSDFKMSKVSVDDNSVYAKLAESLCPVTFDYVKRMNLKFDF